MTIATTASTAVHLLFAGLWSGSVMFVALVVLPLASSGDINAEPLATLTERFQWISRLSAFVLLATGAHLAFALYDPSTMHTQLAGQLVGLMVVLWLALAGLVEVGTAKLTAGTDRSKVRAPAADAKPFLYGAALVAVALLLDAGAVVTL